MNWHSAKKIYSKIHLALKLKAHVNFTVDRSLPKHLSFIELALISNLYVWMYCISFCPKVLKKMYYIISVYHYANKLQKYQFLSISWQRKRVTAAHIQPLFINKQSWNPLKPSVSGVFLVKVTIFLSRRGKYQLNQIRWSSGTCESPWHIRGSKRLCQVGLYKYCARQLFSILRRTSNDATLEKISLSLFPIILRRKQFFLTPKIIAKISSLLDL